MYRYISTCSLTTILPCYYTLHIIYSCSCWVPTISILSLTIFPCYSNLLLRRWRWTGILQWGVLELRCPDCIFPWTTKSSDVLLPWECRLVFERHYLCNNYTFIRGIWHVVNTFYSYVWNKCSWAHMRWVFGFGRKTRYDRSGTRAVSTVGTLA
jgi:hypothetical protein